MVIKGIIEEDFVNYKKPSMVLMFPHCNWKCGEAVCQNRDLEAAEIHVVNPSRIAARYLENEITEALVFSGLEPMCDFEDVLLMIEAFREVSEDPIIIYTGYYREEMAAQVDTLRERFHNIIIKFGRYVPGKQSYFNEILGVELAGDNQYAYLIA